jgi:hypothetical protein
LSSQVQEEKEDLVFLDQSGVFESPELEISQLDPVIHDLEQKEAKLVSKNTALKTKTVLLADQNKDLKDKLEAMQTENKNLEARMANMTAIQASVDKIFHEDQVKCLKRGHMRGSKWSTDTIKKALQLRFSCGKTGYQTLLDSGYPHPSIRTLQKRTEKFNFEPGILDDVIDFMFAKVKGLRNEERLCCLTMDEMSIKAGLDYDKKSDAFIGDVTLPSKSQEKASKALVFQVQV